MNAIASETEDLLIVGAGPTGIAIGAEATAQGLKTLLVERGALTQNLLDFPTFMNFFTTRDKLEIAGIPLTIPNDKPTRQDALLYYRAVAARYKLRVASHEDVQSVQCADGLFTVTTLSRDGAFHARRARAVALATGYFHRPNKLSQPGADLPWVHSAYYDAYRHFNEDVVLIGGGNAACETALELWRNGARSVTMVVRKPKLKGGVKYWVLPDIANRIEEGAIRAHFSAQAESFADSPRRVIVRQADGARVELPCDAVYALIGYTPDSELERRCGVDVDPQTLKPSFNPETCESNVPGLYIAGTLQAGIVTDRIFIENSREHAPIIVKHLRERLKRAE
jgi:thioredoxin reductase (NADPH)